MKKQIKAKKQQAGVMVFVVNKQHVNKLAAVAMDAVKHAHEGVRSVILGWKGERPETLDALKERIKAECKVWLKEEGRKVNPQSIYNYQSDLLAACNGYASYAGMGKAQQAKFDKHEKACSGYHALIKFLRDTKRGKKIARPESTTATRLKSGWKNHAKEQMRKAKDMLRYAPTDNLLALIDFAQSLVDARKKGNVEKLTARRNLQRKVA